MNIIRSEIFKKFPELTFGISTKSESEGVSKAPYYLNMGLSVGDDERSVRSNRELFFKELSIDTERIVFQKQIHSCNVNYVDKPQFIDGSDALFSDQKDLYLAVQIADCAPVFIYDKQKKAVAGIHSGWKGGECNITGKTISEMTEKLGCSVRDMFAFIGPCISVQNYEVGPEFKKSFGKEYFEERDGSLYFDLKKVILHQLLDSGLEPANIEVSQLCTYRDKNDFHSHRRDNGKTGRMMGVIGIRK